MTQDITPAIKPAIKAGDLVAFETQGFMARLIRFGQRWFGRSNFYRVTHIAVAVTDGVDPDLVQAVRRVDKVKLSSYNCAFGVLPFPGLDSQREYVVQWANQQVGQDYGIFAVILRGINYITPSFIRITGERKGHMFCSVFSARAFEHGAVCFTPETDIWTLTPSDLANLFYKGTVLDESNQPENGPGV